jgi:hypothetical protein
MPKSKTRLKKYIRLWVGLFWDGDKTHRFDENKLAYGHRRPL